MIRKIRIFLEMIKFEHTLFALPFAYVGALLTEQRIPSAHNLFWITVAMVAARTAAMALNRLIDRQIDAANPRTRERALPRGLIGVFEVWLYTGISLAVLTLAAYNLSALAVKMLPLVVVLLTFYSYTKRFTWTCHFFLGLALGLAPFCAWAAIAGSVNWAAVTLGLGVLFWVAGFDIVYACDDYEFDRQSGIFSIPARFGIARALQFSIALHLLAAACFVLVGLLLQLNLFYWLGVGSAAGLLYYQHIILSPQNLSRTGIAFFNLNGSLSIVMFLGTLLAILFPTWTI
jgi:4-hydroxybenzoate polyprenyltransferase